MSLDLSEQYKKIYKYCYFKVKNATVAEDLTQETFLKYFKQDTYIENGKQLAYLYVIARNLCVDSYKAVKFDKLQDDLQVDDQTHNIESKIAVKQALKTLSTEQQELLLLRYVNDLSVGEISKITGLSRFAIYRKTTSALSQLKANFREEDFCE